MGRYSEVLLTELTDEQVARGRRWIAWLRDPNNAQTRNRLHDEQGYCCLGGACEVAIQEFPDLFKWLEPDPNSGEDMYYFLDDTQALWKTEASYLPNGVQELFGLTAGAGFYGTFEIDGRGHFNSLVEANDDLLATFAEIADFLEAKVYGRDGED